MDTSFHPYSCCYTLGEEETLAPPLPLPSFRHRKVDSFSILLCRSKTGYIWHHLGREADRNSIAVVGFVFHAGCLPARIQQGKWPLPADVLLDVCPSFTHSDSPWDCGLARNYQLSSGSSRNRFFAQRLLAAAAMLVAPYSEFHRLARSSA